MTRLVCATHGHCFDGLASATLLTELASQSEQLSKVDYIACGYGPSGVAPRFDGDRNALLDFRYHPDEALTYYFDHHATAFVSDEEKSHFVARAAGLEDRFAWDPEAVSCAGLIARIAERQWRIDWGETHAELLAWADKIDGAQFESAEEATSRAEPVMRLAAVVERFGDARFLGEAVPILRSEGLSALTQARFVKDHYRTMAGRFRDYEKRVEKSGKMVGRVAVIDLSEKSVQVVAKFFHYKAYPEALYSVMMTNVGSGLKLSIGFNPWHGAPLDVDIGSICARHGGGGHPVVGAVGFPLDQAARARQVAREITEELQSPAEAPS